MSAHIQARIPDALFRRLEDTRGAETRTAVLVRALEREIRRMSQNARKHAQSSADDSANPESSRGDACVTDA